MTYKIGSLFDGSGGFPLAGSLCGITPAWASEVEPYPIAVTRSRFPDMKHLGDISKINGAEVEPVDIITFGSPCQDLSVAGKRAGLKHEANGDDETTRSGLFMEAVRIIKEMRVATNGRYPAYALWENVPGAFSSNKGEDFRIVLEELIKVVEPTAVMPPVPQNGWPYADSYCGDGWSLAYRVFDAQYWGVPQRRRRIHLVLDLRGQRAGEILFECEGVRGDFAQGGTQGKATAGDAESGAGADDRAGAVPCTLEPGIAAREGGHIYEGVSGTLRANAGDNQMAVCIPINTMLAMRHKQLGRGTGFGIGEDGDAQFTISAGHEHAVCYAEPVPNLLLDDQGGSQISVRTDGKSPTLRAEAHGNVPAVVCYDARGNGDGDTVSTLTGDHENRITDYTSVVVEERPVYCLQGNGIDRADTAGCNGKGWTEDVSYTLNTIDRPAVVFSETYQKTTGPLMANSHPGSYSGQDAYTDMFVVGREAGTFQNTGQGWWNESLVGATLRCGGDSTMANVVCEKYSHPVRYIVRRLTPTECARLQGFPDEWGHPEQKETFSEEEYRFWMEVRNTHATVIGGREAKEYTKEQMVKWYNSLHTDSAEYKMWGNGIALPPALYCMQGIRDALDKAEAPERPCKETSGAVYVSNQRLNNVQRGLAEFACMVCHKKMHREQPSAIDCAWRGIDNEFCPDIIESLKEGLA